MEAAQSRQSVSSYLCARGHPQGNQRTTARGVMERIHIRLKDDGPYHTRDATAHLHRGRVAANVLTVLVEAHGVVESRGDEVARTEELAQQLVVESVAERPLGIRHLAEAKEGLQRLRDHQGDHRPVGEADKRSHVPGHVRLQQLFVPASREGEGGVWGWQGGAAAQEMQ